MRLRKLKNEENIINSSKYIIDIFEALNLFNYNCIELIFLHHSYIYYTICFGGFYLVMYILLTYELNMKFKKDAQYMHLECVLNICFFNH